MIPQLRDYQATLDTGIDDAWARGARNVLAVAPTGGGKTVNMAHKFRHHNGMSVGIAHRAELVSQIALAMARYNVRHRIIGPSELIRGCVRIQNEELGTSFYDPNAACAVAGVDTLVKRNEPWFAQVTLVQTDEAHHVLKANKWGTGMNLFPNARGIGWTATPIRADGKGLGRDTDGLMDAMVIGPTPRELIAGGFLTDYRVFCPPVQDLDLSNVGLSAGGDFSPPALRDATHHSSIVGDVVRHYLQIARGKLGITFAVDVEHAQEIAQAYKAAGVAAEVITANTPDTLRSSILRQFRGRQILQLVNVDLFGEGFDLPALEVVSMARATNSFALYAQQFGRVMRPMAGKSHGIIVDHVGNVVRHGLPDRPRAWSLGRRERRRVSDGGEVPMRVCRTCTGAYEGLFATCPYCLVKAEPAGRDRPDQVDGDLMELTPDALAALRGEIKAVDGPCRIPAHLDHIAAAGLQKRHLNRQQHQADLRFVIRVWIGWRMALGEDMSMIYRRFYFEFGTDTMTAQALGAPDADNLNARITAVLAGANVTVAPGV